MPSNKLDNSINAPAVAVLPVIVEKSAATPLPTRRTRTMPLWSDPGKRLNLLMGALLLLLAVVFMLPGLPPFRVAAPMEFLLPYAPWHSYFPDVTSPFTGGDLLLQQLPWRHWSQDEFAAGRFPLWASSPFGGMPLFASAQPGVLFPLHLLWVMMPIGAGLGIIMALKLWLAGLGMWAFLRALKLHPAAAGLSALSFMFSTSVINWLTWEQSDVIILLPWLAWAVYAWWEGGSRGALVALAAVVASAILAGHPETLFLVGITTGVWVLGLLLSRGQSWRARLGRLAGVAVSAGLGFMIGMIQLLPFLDAVPLSHQGVARAADGDSGAQFHLGARFLLDWLVPRSQGYQPEWVLGTSFGFTEANAYVGLVALVGVPLAVVALLQRRRRPGLVLPWLVMGVFSALIAYDDLIGTFIRALPLFNQSINVRWVIILGFCLIVVGAFGWDWLAKQATSANIKPAKRSALAGAGIAVAMIGALVMLAYAGHLILAPDMETTGPFKILNDNYMRYWAIWAGGVALATVGLAALWLSGSRRARRWSPPFIGLALIIDLWVLLMPVNGTAPADEYFPTTSFQQQVKAIVPPTERIFVEGEVMPANTGLVYNIRDWRAGDPMMSQRAFEAMILVSPDIHKSVGDEYNVFLRNTRREVAPLFGMQYYIFPSGVNPNDPPQEGAPQYTRLANKNGLGLWRAEGAPGFAYLSDNVQAVDNGDGALAWMTDSSWEKTRSYAAVVEARPGDIASVQRNPAGSSPGNVSVEQYTPGHIRLQTNAVRPALLVVAESWYPGWHATIDGHPVADLRANYLSQGVLVPAGEHTVEMDYRPGAFTYGAIISGAGLLGLAAMGVWARKREARNVKRET